MRYLSVCSGIEAATVAWHPLGWQAFAYSEIERFPSAVLAHHYPDTPNLGDMTRYQEWPDANLDVLVGGTPCQSFSVAGLRKGLDDPRGNLMLTYGAIAGRYRPRWLVWENVPGVLSSNGGRDFGAFLGMLAELGYGFAYRVLDAQYTGVAQRRRRVFVVGHLGDWRRAAAVLFERHSLCGHPAPRREAGEGSSVCPTLRAGGNRTGGDRPPGTDVDTADSLIVAHTLRGTGFDASEDGTGRGTPLVPVAFAQNQRDEVRQMEVAGALAAEPGAKQQTYIAFSCKDHGADAGEVSPTLRSMSHDGSHANGGGQVAVAVPLQEVGKRTGVSTTDLRVGIGIGHNGDPMFTLQAGSQHGIGTGMAVRRLTPVECERLQGFPDGYTDIRARGKDTPDGPRYKALGNSMAVPCMRWIGERIAAVGAIQAKAEAA